MKLTKTKLKQIIKEELNKVLNEDGDWSADSPMGRAEAAHCGRLKQELADAIWFQRVADHDQHRGRGGYREYRAATAERTKLEKKLQELGCDYSKLPEPSYTA